MSADDPKAAPILAEYLEEFLTMYPKDDIILRAGECREALAALRAVETAQARIDFEADRCERLMDENERLERAVEAVRALHWPIQSNGVEWCFTCRDERNEFCKWPCDTAKAAGVEAGPSQALLEGEK